MRSARSLESKISIADGVNMALFVSQLGRRIRRFYYDLFPYISVLRMKRTATTTTEKIQKTKKRASTLPTTEKTNLMKILEKFILHFSSTASHSCLRWSLRFSYSQR